MNNTSIEKILSKPPIGLFETNNKVGMIFPILLENNIPTFNYGIPVHNSYLGEEIALNLMKQNDFVGWSIDPWTSKINIKFKTGYEYEL